MLPQASLSIIHALGTSRGLPPYLQQPAPNVLPEQEPLIGTVPNLAEAYAQQTSAAAQTVSSAARACPCRLRRHAALRQCPDEHVLTLWLHSPLQVVNRDVSIAMLRYFGKEREKEKAAGSKSYKKVKGGVMPAALSAGLEEVREAC